jgi:hypothetical protein
VAIQTEFVATGSYQLGALALHSFLMHWGNVEAQPALALYWADDRFRIFQGSSDTFGSDALGVDWAIRMQTDAAAQALEAVLAELPLAPSEFTASKLVTRSGNTLHVFASDQGISATRALAETRGQTLLAEGETQDQPFARRSAAWAW